VLAILSDTAIVSQPHKDTLRLPFHEAVSVRCITFGNTIDFTYTDSVLTFTPQISDTGLHDYTLEILQNRTASGIIKISVYTKGFWPKECANYTHKNDEILGTPVELPDGYFIFNKSDGVPGLYKSPIRNYEPILIPSTKNDHPSSPFISEDGKWISFVDAQRHEIVLLRSNGKNRTIVPISGNEMGYPTMAGFYYQSPYGSEIWYLADTRTLRALRVNLSGEAPIFSNDRILAQFGNNNSFGWDASVQLSVVGDQVFGRFHPIINGKTCNQTGFMTIPNGGRGLASDKDVYQWTHVIDFSLNGCGHTQSHDGRLVCVNPGFECGSDCVPVSHKGFCITPFRRVNDEPVDFLTEHFAKYGTSTNWCPQNYRGFVTEENDFWGWSFSNDNRYIIGRQLSKNSDNAIWVIQWQSNTWYRLTPISLAVKALQPAIFFGKMDTGTLWIDPSSISDTNKGDTPIPVDPFNPYYRIVSPNGGETIYQNEPCSLRISSLRIGNARLLLTTDNGDNRIPIYKSSVNPLTDSVIVITIPDSAENESGIRVSTASPTCLFIIEDYNPTNGYYDFSDSVFAIRKR